MNRKHTYSLPPAFYKRPRAATADMASRTGSTGQWAGVGSICGLYAYTVNALLGPDHEMRPPKPSFWLVAVAHLRQVGTFCGPNLLALLTPVASSPPFYTPLLFDHPFSAPVSEVCHHVKPQGATRATTE
jgi:hypothetical protein